MSTYPQAVLDYYLKGDKREVKVECIEVSHPAFSRVYRFVSNYDIGQNLTVTHEDAQQYEYEPAPVTLSRSSSNDTLDQSVRLAVSDLGEYMPAELRAAAQSEVLDRVTVNIREYLLFDLTQPLDTLIGLEVSGYVRNKQGVVFEASAKKLNDARCGLTYNLRTNPTLRAFR